MIRRLLLWLARLALEGDKIACFILRWAACFPLYVVLGRGALPRTDRSISGWIGACAAEQQPWALFAQRIVNFVMCNANHCQQAIADDGND